MTTSQRLYYLKVSGCLWFIFINHPISVDNNIDYRFFFFSLKCVKEDSPVRLSINTLWEYSSGTLGVWQGQALEKA